MSTGPFTGCMDRWLRPKYLKGFGGVVKKYWEDFHVREIGLDGEICQLTHLVSTNEVRASRLAIVEHTSGKDILTAGEPFEYSEEQLKALKEEAFLTAKDLEVLKTFINTVLLYDARVFNKRATEGEQKNEDEPVDNKRVWGALNVEDAKQLMKKAHCYLVGDVNLFALTCSQPTAVALKTMRTQMHDVIRRVLPFLSTETQVTSDAYECQNKSGGTTAAVDYSADVSGEAREAMAIRRIYLPPDLLTRVQCVKVEPAVLEDYLKVEELPNLVSAATSEMEDSSASKPNNGEPEDRMRFMRITLRPPCIALLLDQSLSSPHLVRVGWGGENRWPKDQPSFLSFHMYKSNRDTAEAIARIAECVGCRPKTFSFAGTKDRRGCTVQRVTGFKVHKEQLLYATTKKDWDRGVRVSDLSYVNKRLRLGDLKGNNFKLVIRDVDVESFGEDKIGELCDVLQRDGFINYFGLQRFGTKRIRTQDVGAALLAHKHERAIRLILGDEKEHDRWLCELRGEDYVDPDTEESGTSRAEGEPPAKKMRTAEGDLGTADVTDEVSEAVATENDNSKRSRPSYNFGPKFYLEERDIDKALANLAPWHHLERAVLQSLKKEPNSFIPALQQLPKSSLALYYHAAQSLVWNGVVSARIAKFGSSRPVVGDLVRLGSADPGDKESALSPSAPGTETATAMGEDEMDESADGNAEELVYESQWFGVKELETEEEASQYSIYDVVLPLPGADVQYPSNMVAEYEQLPKDLLGVTLDDFRDDNRHRLIKLAGNYRTMIEKVGDFDYRIFKAGEFEADKPILATDNDRLLGRAIARRDQFTCGLKPLQCELDTPLDDPSNDGTTTTTAAENEMGNEDGAPSNASSKLGAVLISCSLPRSSYLTVAVRELLSEEVILGFTDRPSSHGNKRSGGDKGGRGGGRGRGRGRGGGGGGRGRGRSRGRA